MTESNFNMEVFVDFPDDAGVPVELTPEHIDSIMANCKRLGATRVAWGYYGEGLDAPPFRADARMLDYGLDRFYWVFHNYTQLGHPLRLAVEAGHRHGMEVYGYFKPYETGLGVPLFEGSPEAELFGEIDVPGGRGMWVSPFVLEHPELRIRRRQDDLPADLHDRPIARLRLAKYDDSPTRLTREHLQIWGCEDNYSYRPLDVDFTVTETIEPAPNTLYNERGVLFTKQGDPVRVLYLDGLKLTEKYILVTTDFTTPQTDFENASTEMLRAYDPDGNEIPGMVANALGIWMREKLNFREAGVYYDHGYGGAVTCLDYPSNSGKVGMVGFTRGRRETLAGALCETEPAVQAYWHRWVEEMLACGVDGIDFRLDNHSGFTDHTQEYGYNPAVLETLAREGLEVTRANIAHVRGRAYTQFLRDCNRKIHAAGRKMRINLVADLPDDEHYPGRRLAFPDNVDFDQLQWIEEELCDEAIYRFHGGLSFEEVLTDPYGQEMLDRCRDRNIPVVFNRYLPKEGLAGEVRAVREDARFTGFILYESATMMRCEPGGQCAFTRDDVMQLQSIS